VTERKLITALPAGDRRCPYRITPAGAETLRRTLPTRAVAETGLRLLAQA
jgi:hypothetical protein